MDEQEKHYADKLAYEIDSWDFPVALVSGEADREIVHRVIYGELCLGRTEPVSRAEYRRIMADLAARGAQAIILGCTEIALLVGPEDAPVPLFGTTRLHAERAVEWMLSA